jgi:hypothetical protein
MPTLPPSRRVSIYLERRSIGVSGARHRVVFLEDRLAAEIHFYGVHPTRLYRKLDVCSRVQLIVCLMAAHLAISAADSNRTDAAAAEPTLGIGRASSAPASSRP